MKKFFLCFSLFFIISSFYLKAEEDNDFIPCDNSLEMFSWDLEFIRHAEHSIEVAACYGGGPFFREFLTEVEARLEVAPHLQVFILTTPVMMEKEDKKIVAKLEKLYPDRFHLQHAACISIVWPNVSGIDNHVKMLIVDETYFSSGGTNLDQTVGSGIETPPVRTPHPFGDTFPACMRDQDIVGRGPFAKELRKTFYKFYSLWEHYNQKQKLERDPDTFAHNPYYKSLDTFSKPFVKDFEASDQLVSLNSNQVKLVLGGPHQKNNEITKEYVRLIKEAKNEISIANLYFSPADPILEALMQAAKRGVKIEIITNGINEMAPAYTQHFCWANRMSYVPLFYGRTFHLWQSGSCAKLPITNTKIYEYYVKDIVLHKKIMIVDEKKFVIGSYNLGAKSDLSDYEMVLVFDSPEIGKRAKLIYKKDIAHSQEISPKWARDWYFDPFISYMGEVQKRFHGLL